MITRLLTAIGLLTFCTATLGENWERTPVPIGAGSYMAIDLDSIKNVSDDVRRAIIQFRLVPAQKSKPTGASYDWVISVSEYNCATNQHRIVEATSFFEGIRLTDERTSMEWRDSGTGNGMIKRVCGFVRP